MNTNPKTPIYSKAVPIFNKGCAGELGDLIPPSFQGATGGKAVNLYPATTNVNISEQRGSTADSFFIGVQAYIDVTVSLSIINPVGVQMKGFEVTSVMLGWTSNKALPLSSYSLTINNVAALITTAYTIDNGFTWRLQVNASITDDTSFRITASDGTKSVSDTKHLRFGHKLYWIEGIKLTESSPILDFQQIFLTATGIGPLSSRKYGNPYIQPLSQSPSVYFYIVIASEYDDINLPDMEKFYEHDGQDPGGGMYLLKQNVPLQIGTSMINYNFYIGLHGAQGGAKFEVK
jgi:hypothetical protein